MKILLDTDIGNDIDDSIALSYLLARPDCEILGITTVRPGALHRCQLVREICRHWGKVIPVVGGAEKPFPCERERGPDGRYNPELDWSTDFPPQPIQNDSDPIGTQSRPGDHIEFMRKIIRENPREVTLLGIGPMTNIAQLFTVDPEIPRLLKQYVTMSGHFNTGFERHALHKEFTEWNVRCDPFAAKIAYAADVPAIHLAMDVTAKLDIPRDIAIELFSSSVFEPVRNYLDEWFQHREFITLHDILAAAVLFEPDLCTYESGEIEVELESNHMRGFTFWFEDKKAVRTRVAKTVDVERFMKHFRAVISEELVSR